MNKILIAIIPSIFLLSCGEDSPSDNFSFKNERCTEYIKSLKEYQKEIKNYDKKYEKYIEDLKKSKTMNSNMTMEEIVMVNKEIDAALKSKAELKAQQIHITEQIENRELACICINEQLNDINTLEFNGENIDKILEQCLDNPSDSN